MISGGLPPAHGRNNGDFRAAAVDSRAECLSQGHAELQGNRGIRALFVPFMARSL